MSTGHFPVTKPGQCISGKFLGKIVFKKHGLCRPIMTHMVVEATAEVGYVNARRSGRLDTPGFLAVKQRQRPLNSK